MFRAMVSKQRGRPLVRCELAPVPLKPGQIRLAVAACGVCRTDLHLVDGELPAVDGPVVPGHEVVGRIVELGAGVTRWRLGDRVGVPWLAYACGHCRYCRRGQENLCEAARFTGYTAEGGGYGEQMVAEADFVLPIPETYDDQAAAPLLCAGLIGYRTWAMAGPAETLGIYGFGAAAHLIAQIAVARGQRVFAFTRDGDVEAQRFARSLGAVWAGGSSEAPPEVLDAALIFAPVGDLVPLALSRVDKGGTVVCGGIHMSEIPAFPYELLWHERVLRSVANLTRKDGEAFMALAAEIPLQAATRAYPLEKANEALGDLRSGRLQGAAVLVP